MKIAFLTNDFTFDNGWGRVSVETVQSLAHKGIDPQVVVPWGRHPGEASGFPMVRRLVSHKDRPWMPWAARLDALMASGALADCEAVHCLTEPVYPAGLFLAERLDVPLYLTAHGTYSVTILKGRYRDIFRRAYSRAAGIFCVSRFTASAVARAIPDAEGKLHPVPLAVRQPDLPGGIPPAAMREPAFAMVGMVKPRKGIMEALTALAKIVETYPLAKLYVVGSLAQKKYVATVREAIAKARLEANVDLMGHVGETELLSIYRRIRGLVVPSQNVGDNFEGFGLVHLEANSFGVPTIGCRDCGNEDAIRHGESGFLVGQRDMEGLVAAMKALLDPNLDWDAFSRKAKAHSIAMNWDRFADRYLEVYCRSLSARDRTLAHSRNVSGRGTDVHASGPAKTEAALGA